MKKLLTLLLLFGISGCSGIFDFKLYSKCDIFGPIDSDNALYSSVEIFKKKIGNEMVIVGPLESLNEKTAIPFKSVSKTAANEVFVMEYLGMKLQAADFTYILDTHMLEWDSPSSSIRRYNCKIL
jgi:hypothetical protein